MTTPYVDPAAVHTPAPDVEIPSAWGNVVRNDLEALAGAPGVCAVRTLTQSIPNMSHTAVAFTAPDEWDTDTFHSPTSNASQVTVPAGFGGRFTVTASLQFASNAAGARVAYIYKNGATTRWENDTDSAVNNRLQVSGEVSLAAGDYVELYVYQNSGAALDLLRGRIAMRWVSR